MASRTLEVHITGDPKHLAGAFRKAGAESQGFGSRLKSGAASGLGALAKGAGFAALGIGVGLAAALKVGVSEFAVHQQASAQTRAALKSTGNAAGTTAGDIARLADALEKKSGMDDIAIQSGANLLLTFTNIRNEAGKGNDVFAQATKTVVDMSVALGQDTKSSAMQLGKALNDPIKGMTALQRVGVSFTKGQKDQVKAMVESGNTIGAQKLILRELNKEFGGSAAAAGKTLPGQLNILKARLSEVAQELASRLIPVLSQVVTWVAAHWPQISSTVQTVTDRLITLGSTVAGVIIPAFSTMVGWVRQNADTLREIGIVIGAATVALIAYEVATAAAAVLTAIWKGISTAIFLVRNAQIALNVAMSMNPIGLIVGALALLAIGLVMAYRHSATFRAIVQGAFGAVKAAASSALGWITGTGIPAVIGAWNRAQPVVRVLQAVVSNAFALIRGYISTVVGVVSALLHGNFSQAFEIAKAAVTKLGSKVGEVVGRIPGVLRSAIGAIGGAALGIGASIVNGILSGVGGLYGRLKAKLESDLKGVLSALNPFSPVEHGGQIHIGEPIVRGALKGVAELGPKLRRALSQQVRDAVVQAKQNLSSLAGSLSGSLNALLDARLSNSAAGKDLKAAQARQGELDFQRQRDELQGTIATGTDDEKTKAQASLDVLLAQRAFDLEQARTDDAKQQNDRRLADLAAALNRGLITQKDYQAQVKALLVGQGADYKTAGDSLGLAFADSFLAQMNDMIAQAKAVVKARLPGLSELQGNVTNPLATVREELRAAREERKQREHDARQKGSSGGAKVTGAEQVGINAARAQEQILQRLLAAMTTGTGPGIVFNQTPANADPQAIAAAIRWARQTVSTA